MSNYGPQDNEEGNRSEPRDTSEKPVSPVKDVFGQSAEFGGPDIFQDMTEDEIIIQEFQQQVKDKFHSIWNKTFK